MTAPTQEQLPVLVASALELVEHRLSGGGSGSGLYDSVRAQLLWVRSALASEAPPDPERLDALLLDVYAAREFETSDPELADVLFNVHYLVKRHWPPPVRDLSPVLRKGLRAATRQYVLIGVVCLLSTILMGFLAFAADPPLIGRIVLLAIAVGGLVVVGWLGRLVATSGDRHRQLLELLEKHPERIRRIQLVCTTVQGDQARRLAIDAPEAANLPARGRLSVVIVLEDATETVPVHREDALPLLEWLRGKAGGA